MGAKRPDRILLACAPEAPGARTLLDAATGGNGASPRVLLTHAGLAWAHDQRLAALARAGAVAVSVCSVDAREQGWTLDEAPSWVAWSSLVAWMRDLGPDQTMWVSLP